MKQRLSANALMAALTLVVGLSLTIFSEKIIVNNGFGWDGAWYGYYAMHFQELLRGELVPVDSRILPSALAHYVLRLFGAALDEPNVILFFEIYGLAVLTGTALFWTAAADRLGLGVRRKWFGYMILFCNHAVLKFSFFYPVLMDSTGVFLSMAAIYFFLSKRPWALLATGAAGLFVWPVVSGLALLLLAFPLRETGEADPPRRANLILALAALAALGVVFYVASTTRRLSGLEMRPWLPLSMAVVAAWVFFPPRDIFSRAYYFSLRNMVSDNRIGPLAPVLGAALACFAMYAAFTGLFYSNPFLNMVMSYFRNVIDNALHRPGEFFVAATLYLGPVLLFMAANAGRFFRAGGRFGWGMALCLCLILFQLLNPITRQAEAGLPFLALMAALSLDEEELTKTFLALFGAVSLLLSKVWMTFNVNFDPSIPGEKNVEFYSRFTSSSGRHMTREWYDAQAAAVLILLVLFVIGVRRMRKRRTA